MRIAIALSLLLIALLVGGLALLPRLITWDDYRAELTEQVEALTGQLVAIQGRIDLELLPRPTLTLARTTLASRAAATAEHALVVDRLDLRLEPLPLLAGRFEVDEIHLVRPVLQLAQPEDVSSALLALTGRGLLLPLAADGPSRLSVVDGRAVLQGAGGAPSHQIEAINLELTAAGAHGPYELSGAFEIAAQPFDFSAQLGQVAPASWSKLQLEVTARASASRASLSFHGVSWSEPDAPRLRGELALSGSDARAGLLALEPALGRPLPPLPDWLAAEFRVAGHLEFAERAAELDELHLALGALEAAGELQLTLGAPPTIGLRLEVPRLSAPELVLPDGAGLATVAALAATAAGRVDLSVGELAWRQGAIQRLRATLVLDGQGGLTVEQARATLPGQTSLAFAGALVGAGEDATLEGELTLVASDLPEALAWLDLQPGALPPGRLRTLSLASRLALSDGTLRFSESELRVDASRLTGSLAVSLGERIRIAGALALDRLNLDAYWPEGELRELVDGTLAAFGRFDAAIEARIGRLTWHDVRLQDLVLDGRSVAGRLTVSQLALDDAAGNHGRLSGELDLEGKTFDLAAELDSTRPAQLLRRLGLEPPLMLARLTPLRASGTLRGDLQTGELALELRHAAARLALKGSLDWSGAPPGYDLAVEAEHPDYPALLDELGVPRTSEAERAAAFSLTGRLQGELGAGAALVGSARLGTMSLTGRAGWQPGPPRPKLTLRLSAGEPDGAALEDLLALVGLQLDPGLLARPQAGAWPSAPLDLRWLTSSDAELELSGKGGLAGTGFELRARLEQGRLMIDRLAAALWGGRIELQSSFDAWRPLPFMALALDLRAIDPGALAAWLDLPPIIEGEADLYAEATAAGDNPRALIGSLIGELRLALRDGRLTAAAPLAVLHATDALDGAGPADGHLAGAPMASAIAADGPTMTLDKLAGRFALKRGIATTPAVSFALDGTPARLEGTIDLLLWVADLQLEVDAPAAPLTLQLIGPLDHPQIRQLPPPPTDPAPHP